MELNPDQMARTSSEKSTAEQRIVPLIVIRRIEKIPLSLEYAAENKESKITRFSVPSLAPCRRIREDKRVEHMRITLSIDIKKHVLRRIEKLRPVSERLMLHAH